MRRFRETLRALVVSPEMFFALAVVAAATAFPNVANAVAKAMSPYSLQSAAVIVGAACGMTVWCWKRGDAIRHPTEAHRTVLIEWADYWLLALRVKCGFTWCVVGVVAGVLGFVFLALGKNVLGVASAALALILPACALITTAGASLDVRDILDGAQAPHD